MKRLSIRSIGLAHTLLTCYEGSPALFWTADGLHEARGRTLPLWDKSTAPGAMPAQPAQR